MSPEQREGSPADARTDVYALGVLAAELLTDESPMRAQVTLAGRRDRLARIVRRCLEIDADDRYGSVREFAAAVRSHLDRRCDSHRHRRRAVRLMLWGIVLAVELTVIATLVVRGRLTPPVSRPVFEVEAPAQLQPDRPPAT
jgi:serine/threonine-protein kinase